MQEEEEESGESEVELLRKSEADPRKDGPNKIRSPDEGNNKWLSRQQEVEVMLEELWKEKISEDNSEETPSNQTLSQLNHKNFPILHRAHIKLSIMSKNKKLDVFL